ncbi:MAG: hypothetical protein WA823_19255 [Candidatus Acidiferrales bacterium]
MSINVANGKDQSNLEPFREPTGIERAILARLLEADFPGKVELSDLLGDVRVRTLDKDCGVELRSQMDGEAPVVKRIPVEAEGFDTDGAKIHVLLHVVGGRPVELEIFREGALDVQKFPDPSSLELIVLPPAPKTGYTPRRVSMVSSDKNAAEVTPGSPAALTRADVIRWWELRRIPYNVTLLVIGTVALYGGAWVLGGKRPELTMDVWPIAIPCFVYGFIANIFYTLGWVVELWGRTTDAAAARRRAVLTFRAGFALSCVLTTLPFWVAMLARLLGGAK